MILTFITYGRKSYFNAKVNLYGPFLEFLVELKFMVQKANLSCTRELSITPYILQSKLSFGEAYENFFSSKQSELTKSFDNWSSRLFLSNNS